MLCSTNLHLQHLVLLLDTQIGLLLIFPSNSFLECQVIIITLLFSFSSMLITRHLINIIVNLFSRLALDKFNFTMTFADFQFLVILSKTISSIFIQIPPIIPFIWHKNSIQEWNIVGRKYKHRNKNPCRFILLTWMTIWSLNKVISPRSPSETCRLCVTCNAFSPAANFEQYFDGKYPIRPRHFPFHQSGSDLSMTVTCEWILGGLVLLMERFLLV